MNRKTLALTIALATILITTLAISSQTVTAASTDLEIKDVSLSIIEATEQSLLIEATAVYKSDIASEQTFELLINGEVVYENTTEFSAPNETKITNLRWPVLREGAHTLTVKVRDVEVEKILKVTKENGKYDVVELATDGDATQTHVLDFKTGSEYDISVREGDIIQAEFESQIYLFTVENVSSTIDISFRDATLGVNFEDQSGIDLDDDNTEDLIFIFSAVSISDPSLAALTIKSASERTGLDLLASFWWVGIIVVVILLAFFLMRKTEALRIGHKKRLLKRVETYHKTGVLKGNLYKKAKQALRKKLKP